MPTCYNRLRSPPELELYFLLMPVFSPMVRSVLSAVSCCNYSCTLNQTRSEAFIYSSCMQESVCERERLCLVYLVERVLILLNDILTCHLFDTFVFPHTPYNILWNASLAQNTRDSVFVESNDLPILYI